jgi:hypothetical protein
MLRLIISLARWERRLAEIRDVEEGKWNHNYAAGSVVEREARLAEEEVKVREAVELWLEDCDQVFSDVEVRLKRACLTERER